MTWDIGTPSFIYLQIYEMGHQDIGKVTFMRPFQNEMYTIWKGLAKVTFNSPYLNHKVIKGIFLHYELLHVKPYSR